MQAFYIFLFCIVFSLIGYLFGSVIIGAIITKIMRIDIRSQGSGNVGSTNVLRTLGKKFALLTFTWDSFKGWLSVFISYCIYINIKDVIPSYYSWCGFIIYFSGMFAIIGHCWPTTYIVSLIKNKFNFELAKKYSGGKGAATTAGFMISISPWIFLASFTLFFIIVLITKYVSLSSILSISIACLLILIPNMDYFYMYNILDNNSMVCISSINHEFMSPTINFDENWQYLFFVFVIFFIVTCIVIYKHKSNIIRLLTKTENKISIKRKIKHI